MATDLVFTPSGGSAVTFLKATAPVHKNAGRWWEERPAPPPRVHAENDIESQGTDGMDTKDGGFRRRVLGPFKVVYSAADPDTVMANFIADCDALTAKDVAITVPNVSGTYPGCWFDAESMQSLHLVPQQSEDKYFMEVGFLFTNKRMT